jgi:hypothetical protein
MADWEDQAFKALAAPYERERARLLSQTPEVSGPEVKR